MWEPSSPYDGIEVPLNEKFLVWCAIFAKFIFGPYFLTSFSGRLGIHKTQSDITFPVYRIRELLKKKLKIRFIKDLYTQFIIIKIKKITLKSYLLT